MKRFWFPLLLSFALIAGMAVLSTRVVPLEWRVTGEGWAVILPLAYVLLSFRSIHRLLTDWFFSVFSLTCGCHILYPVRSFFFP